MKNIFQAGPNYILAATLPLFLSFLSVSDSNSPDALKLYLRTILPMSRLSSASPPKSNKHTASTLSSGIF